ncbi:MAG: 3-deoxy-manno-octulosonate cytidylyltransferase, partial [Steroidobacteraceae bacterium]
MFRVVVPARYASTRLPGKVLLPIAGKTVLQWVCERARASRAAEVVVATDDPRIAKAADRLGVGVVMTAAAHPSGTDRIAEAAFLKRWGDDDVVVNLQADEPLMPPALIDQVSDLLGARTWAAIATLASPLTSVEELLDSSVVKVVADRDGRALYFSRAPIPWDRDGAPAGIASQRGFGGARRHIGIYAYR